MPVTFPDNHYFLARIYSGYIYDCGGSDIIYKKAFKRAISYMKSDREIIAMLIYSNKSQIVIKRKWIPGTKKRAYERSTNR